MNQCSAFGVELFEFAVHLVFGVEFGVGVEPVNIGH